MNADLERLIALQRLDSAAMEAQRRIAEEPDLKKALEARLDTARQQLAEAKQRLADNQTARRTIEKDVAVHQGRLSKFADQLMAVKTNVEYQAMQKEIGFAKGEVKLLEDRILERIAKERADLIASLPPQAYATFDLVSKRRNGVALAEARDGICTICHVRLRPQVFNTVRQNAEIIQCETCQRILYFVPRTPAPGGVSPSAP